MAAAVEIKPSITDRYPVSTRDQDSPGQAADFKTAYLGQHVQSVFWIGLIDLQGFFYGLDLSDQPWSSTPVPRPTIC